MEKHAEARSVVVTASATSARSAGLFALRASSLKAAGENGFSCSLQKMVSVFSCSLRKMVSVFSCSLQQLSELNSLQRFY
jgi:hypothetical protein